MPLLIKPFLGCNLNCKYCYEHGLKDRTQYDIDKIIATIDKLPPEITNWIILHGGEALMMGHKDVERILSYIKEKTKKSAVQTNGTLIDSKYIELFKKYNTEVGVSIDGDGELNDLRCNIATTNKIIKNIYLLLENKIPTSVIITIHTHNAGTDEQLDRLKTFILQLTALNITGRININHSEYALSENRMGEVFLNLGRFMLENGIIHKWGLFSDIIKRLQNQDNVVCFLRGCDIYHTNSALPVLGDGSQSSCLRSGIMVRHPQELNIRNEILSQLDKKDGGCKDCKFWTYCKGGCPSNAEDWRVRDPYCIAQYTLFEYYSKIMLQFEILKSKEPPVCSPKKQTNFSNHSDGIEHIDGETRHMDG